MIYMRCEFNHHLMLDEAKLSPEENLETQMKAPENQTKHFWASKFILILNYK